MRLFDLRGRYSAASVTRIDADVYLVSGHVAGALFEGRLCMGPGADKRALGHAVRAAFADEAPVPMADVWRSRRATLAGLQAVEVRRVA